MKRWNTPFAAEMLRVDIPEGVLSSLRQTYTRGYAVLEKAIAEALGEINLQNVTDIEVHADHLRLSTSLGSVVKDIPFDVSDITPRRGTFELLLDRDKETIFVLSGDDTDVLTPALKESLLDVLRPYYWLVEGAKEPGANPLLFEKREIREFLASMLERSDVSMIHPQIQAVVRAMNRGQYMDHMGASEFVQSLKRASLEFQRNGLNPALQDTLKTVARISAHSAGASSLVSPSATSRGGRS